MALCVKCRAVPNTGQGDLCEPCFVAAMAIYDSYHIVRKLGSAAWQDVVREIVGRARFEVAIGLLDDETKWRANTRRNASHQKRIDLLLQRLAKVRGTVDPSDPAYALGVEYGLL